MRTSLRNIPDRYDTQWLARVLDDFTRALRDRPSVFEDVVFSVAPTGTGRARRLILQSPNGTYWEVSVDDTGALSTTSLGDSL